MSFYELAPKDYKGQEKSFSDLKGKVVLIVNVATKCKFAPQFRGLEELNQRFAGQGFEVIAFPCNQFAKQEPKDAVEVISYCSINYGVSFPVMYKVKVNGKNADPVFKFLKSKKTGLIGNRGIAWNFSKFLIDQDGNVIKRYLAFTRPRKLASKIEKLLNNNTATPSL